MKSCHLIYTSPPRQHDGQRALVIEHNDCYELKEIALTGELVTREKLSKSWFSKAEAIERAKHILEYGRSTEPMDLYFQSYNGGI